MVISPDLIRPLQGKVNCCEHGDFFATSGRRAIIKLHLTLLLQLQNLARNHKRWPTKVLGMSKSDEKFKRRTNKNSREISLLLRSGTRFGNRWYKMQKYERLEKIGEGECLVNPPFNPSNILVPNLVLVFSRLLMMHFRTEWLSEFASIIAHEPLDRRVCVDGRMGKGLDRNSKSKSKDVYLSITQNKIYQSRENVHCEVLQWQGWKFKEDENWVQLNKTSGREPICSHLWDTRLCKLSWQGA